MSQWGNNNELALQHGGFCTMWLLVAKGLLESNIGFCGEGKTGAVPGEKPLGAKKRTNKLNPHMTPSLGIEPGSHWWEASAVTTVPPLLPGFRRECHHFGVGWPLCVVKGEVIALYNYANGFCSVWPLLYRYWWNTRIFLFTKRSYLCLSCEDIHVGAVMVTNTISQIKATFPFIIRYFCAVIWDHMSRLVMWQNTAARWAQPCIVSVWYPSLASWVSHCY